MITFHTDPEIARAAGAFSRARTAAAKSALADQRPVAERMAEAMIEMAANGQIVTAETLCLRGFTRAEIDRCGAEAADRATAFERGELEAA